MLELALERFLRLDARAAGAVYDLAAEARLESRWLECLIARQLCAGLLSGSISQGRARQLSLRLRESSISDRLGEMLERIEDLQLSSSEAIANQEARLSAESLRFECLLQAADRRRQLSEQEWSEESRRLQAQLARAARVLVRLEDPGLSFLRQRREQLESELLRLQCGWEHGGGQGLLAAESAQELLNWVDRLEVECMLLLRDKPGSEAAAALQALLDYARLQALYSERCGELGELYTARCQARRDLLDLNAQSRRSLNSLRAELVWLRQDTVLSQQALLRSAIAAWNAELPEPLRRIGTERPSSR